MIFKLKMIEYSNYNSYRFTFQSGDIQIASDGLLSEITKLFTFQSGDIQMDHFHCIQILQI